VTEFGQAVRQSPAALRVWSSWVAQPRAACNLSSNRTRATQHGLRVCVTRVIRASGCPGRPSTAPEALGEREHPASGLIVSQIPRVGHSSNSPLRVGGRHGDIRERPCLVGLPTDDHHFTSGAFPEVRASSRQVERTR